MGKPSAEPRSHGFHDRFQSCFVIHMPPASGFRFGLCRPKRLATYSVSPMAKSETRTTVISTPSIRSGTPKVSRCSPEALSMPTRPSDRPMNSAMKPRTFEVPITTETDRKASSISPK